MPQKDQDSDMGSFSSQLFHGTGDPGSCGRKWMLTGTQARERLLEESMTMFLTEKVSVNGRTSRVQTRAQGMGERPYTSTNKRQLDLKRNQERHQKAEMKVEEWLG